MYAASLRRPIKKRKEQQMRVAIIGFPGVGKSTVFELLTGVQPDAAAVQNGQVAVTDVPDPRLAVLADIYRPGKATPAAIEFMDTPPLSLAGGRENARVLG
jgi:hypothetical protein